MSTMGHPLLKAKGGTVKKTIITLLNVLKHYMRVKNTAYSKISCMTPSTILQSHVMSLIVL